MPLGGVFVEHALRHQNMQVAVEVQVAPKGVEDDHDQHGQSMQEMVVLLEQRPEHIRHG